MTEVTQILHAVEREDHSTEQLFPLVYELRVVSTGFSG